MRGCTRSIASGEAQQVENPLAQAILAGKFVPGDRIRAKANGNGLEFAKDR
jgi:hypothetical protein